MWNHPQSILEHFHHLKNAVSFRYCLFSHHPLSSRPKQPLIYFLSIALLVMGFHINRIISYPVLWDWFHLIIIMFSGFIHIVACINTLYGQIIIHCMIVWIIAFFKSIHQFVDIWVFPPFGYYEQGAIQIHYRFLSEHIFSCLSCIPKHGTAGSCVNCAWLFEYLQDCFPKCLYHFIFPSVYKAFSSPYPRQHLLLFDFFW
jgi:hypothetical protein